MRLRAFHVTGVSVGCATGFLLAVPLVFRAPSGLLAVRAASFARRVGSKPGQVMRLRRRPPHWWCVVAGVWPDLTVPPVQQSFVGPSLAACLRAIRMLVTYPCVIVSVGPGSLSPDGSAFGLVAQWYYTTSEAV